MRVVLIGLVLIVIITSLVFFLPKAHAAEVHPAAPNFGFGARLDILGQQVQPSLNVAAGLGLDWIAVDFDWAAMMPDPNLLPDLASLNTVMESAGQSNTPVMLSILSAPTWANTPGGPDPNLTASLVISLARLYPGTLRAIELYPPVNTRQGWGAPPDPAAFASLFQTTQAALQSQDLQVTLVASLAPASGPGDADDRAYLEKLYQLGAASWMQVLGVRLPLLTGDPMADPAAEANAESGTTVLRHYEILRQVMLHYNHADGLIWITGFTWPSDAAYNAPEGQSYWMNKAYQLIRSQLYIEVAFFRQLNPPASGVDPATGTYISLVLPDASLHPVCSRLTQLASLDGNVKTVSFQGPISKKTPLKASIKP